MLNVLPFGIAGQVGVYYSSYAGPTIFNSYYLRLSNLEVNSTGDYETIDNRYAARSLRCLAS